MYCKQNQIADQNKKREILIFSVVYAKKNLRIVYGPMVTKKSGFSSYMNLFKPSVRENDYGRVIAQSLHQIGISVEKIEGVSEVVCSP